MPIADVLAEMTQVFGRGYPAFVYRDTRELGPDYLPVFAFHSLEPRDFDAKLVYLAANGYRTVSLDLAVEWMEGRAQLPPRSVALTIDDGRLSTWTVGYPLLRRYGMTATAFVMPGYIEDGMPRALPDDPLTLTVDEHLDGRTVLRWSEVRALHDSGVIAIESHSMLHRKVVLADRAQGFLNPDAVWPAYEIPLAPDAREGWSAERQAAHLGLPLFVAAPVLAVDVAQPVRAEVEQACIRVAWEGGPGFFRERDWSWQLRRALRRAGPPLGEPVPLVECQRWELATARRVLEERLPGKVVRHFCYPRGRGSFASERLVQEAGYRSACWSFLPHGATNHPGASPFRIGRLKHDFVHRLPGDGARPLRTIVARKVARRLRGETGY